MMFIFGSDKYISLKTPIQPKQLIKSDNLEVDGNNLWQNHPWLYTESDALMSILLIERLQQFITKILNKMNFSLEIQYELRQGDHLHNKNLENIKEKNHCKSSSDQKKLGHHWKRKLQLSNEYNWNDTENKRYIDFLVRHSELIQKPPQQRKKSKINILMSKSIKTRTSTQCRTHHQKMVEKYGNLKNIVQEYKHLLQQPRERKQQTFQQQKQYQNNEDAICLIEQKAALKNSTDLQEKVLRWKEIKDQFFALHGQMKEKDLEQYQSFQCFRSSLFTIEQSQFNDLFYL